MYAAVSGLKADYEADGHRLDEAINSVLEKNVRLRKKYKRPDRSSDRLYQSGVIHPPDDESACATACGDDSLILRPDRTEDENNPAVHYSLIASANQLMKDALVRDKLVSEKNVLCFEREAAGLMNRFPCLVTRGICDYSDSHQNKQWQGYAAMTAAAYARELLHRTPPNKVEAQPSAFLSMLTRLFANDGKGNEAFTKKPLSNTTKGMKVGKVIQSMLWADTQSKKSTLTQRKLTSMDDHHGIRPPSIISDDVESVISEITDRRNLPC